MGSKRLTERQREVLEIIRERIKESGYPPTIREIGEAMGISEKGAYDHLKALEKKGYIRRHPRKTRAIEIIRTEDQEDEFVRVPILKGVDSSMGITVDETQSVISLPRDLFDKGVLFALRVEENGMFETGIFKGDYVIIRKQDKADPGDIVAVLTDDDEFRIMVMPANTAIRSIWLEKGRFLGKVVGLLRRF
ncbi:TPA: repressor LexA [Candidatus Poribacteria bacterium]|nr:repressor LexA [Candidatus Poribacteria bacterium]HEX30785.1 repressor LexA [Candidatus Poribacteria bacterium]